MKQSRFPISIIIPAALVLISLAMSGLFVASGILNYRQVTKQSDMKLGLVTMLSRNSYVEVHAERAVYIGYDQTRVLTSLGKYYLVKLEDSYMLALLPNELDDSIGNYVFPATVKPATDDEKYIVTAKGYGWQKLYNITVEDKYVIHSLEQDAIPEGYLVMSLGFTAVSFIALIILSIRHLIRQKKRAMESGTF